jgi:protein arginine N-methyltransferase 1
MHDLPFPDDTPLVLVSGLRTRTDAAGHVLIELDLGREIDAGPLGYRILGLLSEPRTLDSIVTALREQHATGTNFMPAMAVLNALLDSEALAPIGPASATSTGWADPAEQARMLHDDRRTNDYLSAIAAGVRPGDVVVDIGTGNGVLAVAAARAGARHVYAVEATDIADVAEEVFAVNGVSDRITVVRGWSRNIELPERADVLVTETIGSEPLEEDILGAVLDARRRLLRPGALMIPRRLTLQARPLLLPDEAARQRSIGPDAIERWKHLYDMDFQPLLDAAFPEPLQDPIESETVALWPPVGPVVDLASVDLTTFEHPHVEATADLPVDAPGAVNAVAVTFRADLFEGVEHTLDPWTWPLSSWATSVWVLPTTFVVRTGQAIEVHYRHHAPGAADGLACEVVERPRF